MRDDEKSKEQLISELAELRKRFDEQESKLKRAQEIEKALRESEKRSNELADLLPQMIFETDDQGNLVYGNRCAYETLGYTTEDTKKGLNVIDVVLPEDRPVIIDNLIKTIAGQQIEHPRNDFTIVRKDGTTFPSLIWPSIIIRDNKPAGIRGVCVDITEMKKAEEALRQSEEKLRLTFESIKEGITITDLEGHVILTNEAGLRMSGYNRKEEIIGRSGLDFIVEKDRSHAIADLTKQLRGRVSSTLSYYTLVDKNGKEYDAEVSASVMPDIYGTPVGFIVVVRDITSRRQMERALRESEEKLRLTFESIDDSIIVIDLQGHVMDVNEAAVRIAGFNSKNEVIGINAFDLISPPDRERVVKDFTTRQEGRFHQRMEYKIRPIHGEEFLAEITASSLSDASRNPIGYIAVLRDITESKRAVEALRRSEERYRLVAENVSDVIWIMDMNARYTYISPSVKRMRGYTAEEMMALPAQDLVTPESAALILNVLSEELTLEISGKADPHRVRTLEMESKNKDGSIIWIEVKITFMRDPEGKPIGILGVSRDITERKRTEDKLRESEQKYKELVEREKDIIFSVDASGNFTSINSAVLSWGFTPEQIIGRHFSEFIPLEWHSVLPQALDQILSADEITAELVVSDANGKGHPIEFSATVIKEGNEYRGVRGIVRDITERKRIEEALRDSEEKLRLTFESINEAIILTDLEGRILDINEAGFRMSGYDSKSQVIGLNGIQFFEEKARLSVLEQLAKLLKEGRIPIMSYKIVSRTGMVYDCEASAVLLRDNTGNPLSLIVVIRDVSERKRMEEALRDSEEKLRFMFASIIDAVVVVDLEGKILEVNDAGLRLTGFSAKDELTGYNAFDFVAEEDRERALNDMLDSFKDGPGFLVQYRFKNKQGDLLFVEARGGMVYNTAGDVTGHIVVVRDITQRRRMEEALRDSEEKLRLTFDSIQDGIVVIDLNGHILDVNQATLRIGGYGKKSQVIGRNAFELIAPKDYETVMDDLKASIEGRPKERMEYSIQPKGGKVIEVELTASIIRDEKGNPSQYIAVLRDITDRKQAENQLRENEQKYKELVEREKDVIFSMNESGAITSVNSAVTVWGYTPEEIIGKHYSSFAPAQMLKELEAELPRQLLTKGEVVAETLSRDKHGNWRPIEFSATVILKDNNFAGVRGIVRDITERKRAEEALKQRNRELSTLNKIAEAVSHPVGLSRVLRTALDSVLETMHFAYGSIWLLDKATLALYLSTARGAKDLQTTIADMSKAWQTGKSTITDYYHEGKPAKSNKMQTESGVENKSIIGIPLKSRGEMLGVLGIICDRKKFSDDDIRLLETIGDQIAVAIENVQLVEKLNELSITDELTKLYNRRRFYEVLENEMNRTRRYGRCTSIAMIDLDGFKKYNDRFGHASGDVVLTDFAGALKEGLRKTDSASRYGGDEFAVILPSTNADRAREVIERIRRKWLKRLAAQQAGLENVLGFSAGIAQFPENAETVDGLVFLTDTALYYAKRGGKQRVMLISDLGTTSLDVFSSQTLDQIYALAATVDTRDPFTYGHSKRVAAIAESLGRTIGLKGDELSELVAAAFLHDIGKVGVADVILTKAGKPEKEEWEAIRKHCAEGAKIVQHVKELAPLAPYILHHHEWYDGSGYPDKLKGEKIPLAARIISVADAYDTMTAQRPYRDAISPQEALEEMDRCAGTQFDPKLIEALRRISRSGLLAT